MRTQHPTDPALRDYVRCLWSVERAFAPPADTFELLPDRYVELVFTAGARFALDHRSPAARPHVLPQAYVVGLLDGPVRLRARGTVRAVAARCYAWSIAPLLAPLLDGPAGAAPAAAAGGPRGGGIRPLHPAHVPLVDAIGARLDAGDVAGALDRLHDALRALATTARPAPASVGRSGRALGGAPGDAFDLDGTRAGIDGATVRRAAAAGGLTPRQLERQFRALAGVTPKGYARRARFERARDRLWAAPKTSLSALAAECGYADQAHLTREFTAFAGQPAGRWAAGVARTRALLHPQPVPHAAPETARVAFLQDG